MTNHQGGFIPKGDYGLMGESTCEQTRPKEKVEELSALIVDDIGRGGPISQALVRHFHLVRVGR